MVKKNGIPVPRFIPYKPERIKWTSHNPVAEWFSWIEVATIKHYIPTPAR